MDRLSLSNHGRSSRNMGFADFRGQARIRCDQSSTVIRLQFRTAGDILHPKAVSASRH
jgi:hypothetical protein